MDHAEDRTGTPLDVASVQVGMDAPHELLEGAAAMVASDVGVEVQPDALNAIGVRAVRRQEVEDNPAAEFLERLSRLLAAVDGGVVQDEVDSWGARVLTGDAPKQLDEE